MQVFRISRMVAAGIHEWMAVKKGLEAAIHESIDCTVVETNTKLLANVLIINVLHC